MKWIAGLGKVLGGVLASDDMAADNRRHRERVISQGLARIQGQPADKATLQAVLRRQKDIHALQRRLKDEDHTFDAANAIKFDGLTKLKPFQDSKKGYILVYAQGFLTELLQRLIKTRKSIASVVFRPYEDPAAHISVLERGHGLAFEMPFFPDEDPAMLCEFFGEITAVSQKAAAFAGQTKAPLLPIWCRVDDDGLTLEIGPPIKSRGSVESLTLALVDHFEKRIRASPAAMDWKANCWDPPLSSILPSRFPWRLTLKTKKALADVKSFHLLARVPDTVREACLAIPAIRALKYGRPDVHLTVLTTAAMVPFWQWVAECDACLDLEAAASKEAHFELGIMFNRDDKQAVSQIKRHSVGRVIGMENHSLAQDFDHEFNMPRKLGPPEHRHRTNLRLAHRLGAEVVNDPNLRGPVLVNPITPGSRLVIGIAPDSDDGPAYIWPTESFIEVISRISKTRPITWRAFIHSDSDASEWETLRNELGPDAITLVTDATTAEERLVGLQGCGLILANDNDFLHLATAIYGMPGIVIYGPSEPIETAPTSPEVLTLRRHVECTPCFLKECPLDHRCLNEIDVDEVIAALETSLARLED